MYFWICALLWLACGFVPVFLLLQDYFAEGKDITVNDIGAILFFTVFGVFTLVIAISIFGSSIGEKVVFRRKKKMPEGGGSRHS